MFFHSWNIVRRVGFGIYFRKWNRLNLYSGDRMVLISSRLKRWREKWRTNAFYPSKLRTRIRGIEKYETRYEDDTHTYATGLRQETWPRHYRRHMGTRQTSSETVACGTEQDIHDLWLLKSLAPWHRDMKASQTLRVPFVGILAGSRWATFRSRITAPPALTIQSRAANFQFRNDEIV